jgi:hypothetical protein
MKKVKSVYWGFAFFVNKLALLKIENLKYYLMISIIRLALCEAYAT